MRVAACIEYDGTAFSGWQTQASGPTVQHHVEAALTRVAAEPIRVVCAGRTDTKVHATNQIIHFDTAAVRPTHAWVLGGNSHLPADISLVWAQPVPTEFHARFSARRRAYRYVILNAPTRPALLRDRVAWLHRELNHEQMRQASQALLGQHDFSSLRAVACQAKSPIREIYSIDVLRHGELIYIDVAANAFLHHMVRNMVGLLVTVGCSDKPATWVAEVLAARDRRVAGVTAPAQGLYLVQVNYEPHFGLPSEPRLPSFG